MTPEEVNALVIRVRHIRNELSPEHREIVMAALEARASEVHDLRQQLDEVKILNGMAVQRLQDGLARLSAAEAYVMAAHSCLLSGEPHTPTMDGLYEAWRAAQQAGP